jgi:choline dehydrogenase
VQEAGYPRTDDVNGYRQEGFAPFDRNVHRGRRLSASPGVPAPGAEAAQPHRHHPRDGHPVLFEGKRRSASSTGGRGKVREQVDAGEVILCGGAINSPQLLQLSGVGNAEELSALGIDVVHDLPGVGENLQDHLEVYIQYACKQPVSMQPYMAEVARPLHRPAVAVPHGPGATNHFEAGGFARSNEDVDYPNLMFHFLPIAVRYDGSSPPAATATRCTSGRCTPTPAAR